MESDIIPLSDKSCVEGTVHLVGSDHVSKGRVEYCYNGMWYSVCADGWSATGNEAGVICNTMGFTTYDMVTVFYRRGRYNLSSTPDSVVIDYGQGTSPVLTFNVTCSTGLEKNCFTEEPDNGWCTHVAGVDCVGR